MSKPDNCQKIADDDEIAAFIARGGQITRVEEGAGVNLTAREWRSVVRGGPAPHGSTEYLWEMGFAAEAKARVRG